MCSCTFFCEITRTSTGNGTPNRIRFVEPGSYGLHLIGGLIHEISFNNQTGRFEMTAFWVLRPAHHEWLGAE